MVSRFFLILCAIFLCTHAGAEVRKVLSAEEAVRLGDRAFLNRRYSEAELYYRQAMELAPKHAAPAVNLGRLFYAQSRYADARQMFERAQTLKQDRATRKFLDFALRMMDRMRPLLERIEGAKNADPIALSRLHAEAADFLAGQSSFMAMLGPHLEYLLSMNPLDVKMLLFIAEGYYLSGLQEQSFLYYETLAKLKLHDARVYSRFGDVAVNVGAYDSARFSYKKALREAVRERNIKEVRSYKKLIRKLPAFSQKIDALIQAKDSERAFRELRKCLVRNPSNPVAMVQMGKVYEDLGRLRQAEDLYRQAVKWNHEDPNAHYALGLFYMTRKNQSEKALEEFKLSRTLLDESLQWTDNDVQQKKMREYLRESTRSIAYVYLEVLRQPKLAITELKTLVDVENPEAADYYMLGVAYLKDHKRTSSYQALQKAIHLDPKSEAAMDAQELIESVRIESRDGFPVETG